MPGSSAPEGHKQAPPAPPPQDWSIDAALAWLNAKVNFERQPNRDLAVRVLKLDRMRALSAALGHPHLAVPAIHVAGSKGKGSITRMAASILTAAGPRTGAFTSPHLILPNERVAIDRLPVSDADLAAAIWRVSQAEAHLPGDVTTRFGSPTYFEAITAAAFDHFAQARCDAAVYEVGLGGRLDSTNILEPSVCVLASIELEHTDILGHTLPEIAREKAGILKPGVPAICTPQPPEVLDAFREQAEIANAPLRVLGRDIPFEHRMESGHALIDVTLHDRHFTNLRSPIPGAHQAANTAAAVAACAIFLGDQLTDAAIADGLERAPRDGRMEVVGTNPTVIIDGAHTPSSIRALLNTMSLVSPGRWPIIVFGCARDKDVQGMLEHLAGTPTLVICTQSGPRAKPASELADLLDRMGCEADSIADAREALSHARKAAGGDGTVLVCGSFMLAGAVKALC